MTSDLKIFSGNCCFCDIGVPVGAKDVSGDDLHTGDVVVLYSVLDEDTGQTECIGLTAVVSDQYQSYSDGTIRQNPEPVTYFCMGIKCCGFNDPGWEIKIVKKFRDVIEGERWPRYGFSYRRVDPDTIVQSEDAA